MRRRLFPGRGKGGGRVPRRDDFQERRWRLVACSAPEEGARRVLCGFARFDRRLEPDDLRFQEFYPLDELVNRQSVDALADLMGGLSLGRGAEDAFIVKTRHDLASDVPGRADLRAGCNLRTIARLRIGDTKCN